MVRSADFAKCSGATQMRRQRLLIAVPTEKQIIQVGRRPLTN